MVIDVRTKMGYNVKKYFDIARRTGIMVLDSILFDYKPCKKYSVNKEVADYIKYIDIQPKYIIPNITEVKIAAEISTLNPKFRLFSAPGATGKSALAKYISNRFGALYWDLAKLKLGTNSFIGSILNAVGAPSYSSFIADLNSGLAMLAIDAFDEAEIVSGRKMLGSFIMDMSNSLAEHNGANIFLFARTETAQFIATFCAENSIPLAHYEIGYFSEDQSKEFIGKSIGDRLTPADRDCIDSYYSAIKRNIPDNERTSFLGYAPVLEAIAKHIGNTPNRKKMISDLSSKNDCTDIILNIMKDLLRREQTEKVVAAFQERCKETHPEFTEWDRVYSAEEQLVRLINYIIFESDVRYENCPLDFLPPQLIDDYQELLNMFLPQHPFIRNSFLHGELCSETVDFAGPAFRDYTLARLIIEQKHTDLAYTYFEESIGRYYFPSQIFFDCYTSITGGVISAPHLSYVYDSYKAKSTALERPYLQCSEIPGDAETPASAIAVFGMLPSKGGTQRADITLDVDMSNGHISFDQLTNVSIDTPSFPIHLGQSSAEVRITNSSIICNDLFFDAKNVVIESYPPEGTLIAVHNMIVGEAINIDITPIESLRICAKNINAYFRLIPYEYDFEDTSSIDITKFTHAMRCILIEFRTHKKDTPAKDAERIENVVVGGSPIKRSILDYMIERGVIYRAEHLYKVELATMQKLGISYSALARMDTNQLGVVYSDFCNWDSTKNK